MYKSQYTTNSRKTQRDGRNGNEFAITTAAKYNSYEAKRIADRNAAAANEANRAQMVAWGMNPNDADLMFA